MEKAKIRNVLVRMPNVALGNGINRYNNTGQINSWHELLLKIAAKCDSGLTTIPKGTSLSEFLMFLSQNEAPRGCFVRHPWAAQERDYRALSVGMR